MFNRWYTIAVALFWMAAMGWLFQQKLLPPLLVGEPPNYRKILSDDSADNQPIAWDVFLNDRLLGKATTRTERQKEHVSEIHSTVVLNDLPLREIAPAVFTLAGKLLGSESGLADSRISIDAESMLQIDPLGHPANFHSTIKLRPPLGEAGMGSPLAGMNLTLSMRGQVKADQMEIKVKFGDFERQTEIYLPTDALIGDVLSPPNYLPELRVGQTWTVPIYSPFRDPREPMEVLHATVERKELVQWRETLVPTLVVAYRGDPGRGMSSNQTVRAQAWVDHHGQVIKQEVALPSARLQFVRSAPTKSGSSKSEASPAESSVSSGLPVRSSSESKTGLAPAADAAAVDESSDASAAKGFSTTAP
ncbi:MAG TPA: hypothetical protein VGJ26_16400 [Pirellulales bacterium]